MILEPRYATRDEQGMVLRGVVLVSESEEESKIIDELFGDNIIDDDGLIGVREVECRLSDGFREHYLYIKA